jgi:hypothetical protein
MTSRDSPLRNRAQCVYKEKSMGKRVQGQHRENKEMVKRKIF